MELRHLRYFVAVAEEGSLKLAAERRLHTAQPSLSRQIRDLESEIGLQLMTRSVRGIQLTEAGETFLGHARLALAQVEAAKDAARQSAAPARPVFSLGFLVGHELDCLPAATAILKDLKPNIELRVFSNFSTTLAADLRRGMLDIAFLRREPEPDFEYRLVAQEKLVAILPRTHPLTRHAAIDAKALAGERFIGISHVPQVLRDAVMGYLKRAGVDIVPHLEIDNFAMAISLVEAEQGVAIMPASILNYLPHSIVSRGFRGEQPTVDLVAAHHKDNESPILGMFLSRFESFIQEVEARANG